ncbi:O-acetyl-ADP-ribose deacetylase [bacterium]|nr:O-acetyl-ADP-ribose deacetylase [bacterium]
MNDINSLGDKLSRPPVTQLSLLQGDITRQTVDALVNAANPTLSGGGGVDAAIHRAGGSKILMECQQILNERGPLEPGQAVSTTGGKLKARRVIHTVGPVWQGGQQGEPELLASCYQKSLWTAYSEGLSSLAFPCISAGAYGYPAKLAAEVAVRNVRTFVREHPGLDEVRFVVFGDRHYQLYQQVLQDQGENALPCE